MWNRFIALVRRLPFVAARRRLSDEMSDELQAHLDLLTARYEAHGLSPGDARLAAKRQLGNLALVREEIHQMNSLQPADVLVQDVRYAFRVFRRTPSFPIVVVATLALGIGANTAILTVAHAVLVKPLPYARPAEIYAAQIVIPERREQIPSLPATVQAYLEWRKAPAAGHGIAALRPWEANISGDGEPERLGGALVSANFFEFLGVRIAQGRGFSAGEDVPGRERVVVISEALWRRRYGGDPGAIGRSLAINGEPHVVIGVAPASLLVPVGTELHALLQFAPRVDIWKPIAPTPRDLANESWDHGVLIRMPEGSNRQEGREQLAALVNELIRVQMPETKTRVLSELVPIREVYSGQTRLRLLLILGASTLLLLTACASVTNVSLARVASRGGELATRLALGAGRARILSQTITEALVLAAMGGAAGAVLAHFGARALASYGPDGVWRLVDAGWNLTFAGLAAAVSLATGVLCGIVPAWQACRRDPLSALTETTRGTVGSPRAGRARHTLVGVEIALATVLLASAGLLLHSFVNVMTTDRGYDVERVLTADLSLFGQRYGSGEGRAAFYGALLEDVRGLPGVQAAGAISSLPAVSVSNGPSRTIFHASDTDYRSLVLARPVAMVRSVTAGYFAASGRTLLAGRWLTDREPVPSAVVSESLARRLWPGDASASVVGRSLRQGDVTGPVVAVVGVVADAQPAGLDREPPPAIYRPYVQWASGPMTLVVRSAQDPAALASAMRSAIATLDPNLPVSSVRTMKEIVSSSVAERRFQMALTSVFACVALILGAVGVYGVVSYAVACRTRDIGLRLALGAVRADVIRSVFASGMRPVVAGLAVGLLATVAAARAFRAVLYGVTPADVVSLAAVTLVLLAASGLACYLPARRAAALDPMVALRHD